MYTMYIDIAISARNYCSVVRSHANITEYITIDYIRISLFKPITRISRSVFRRNMGAWRFIDTGSVCSDRIGQYEE